MCEQASAVVMLHLGPSALQSAVLEVSHLPATASASIGRHYDALNLGKELAVSVAVTGLLENREESRTDLS